MPVPVGTSDISKLQFDGVREVHELLKRLSIIEVGKLHVIWQNKRTQKKKTPPRHSQIKRAPLKLFFEFA